MLIDGSTLQPLDRPVMSLSAYSIQGKRNHMEDFFDIGYQMKPCDQRRPNEWPYEYFYFGIFDGHGGSEAAEFAKANLLKFITAQKDFWSDDDDDIKRAIRNGFAETHKAMKREMSTWTRTSRILPSTAGTTASVLFIKNGKFYSGHVGDSRIVVAKENVETKHWISQQVTEDHKPESAIESERIYRAGGEVRSKIGVHRVVWKRPVLNYDMEAILLRGPNSKEYENYTKLVSHYPVAESLVSNYQVIPFLAIARSLGDFWSLNPYSGQYIVSPEPDITCRPIESDDKCILLATDGLWNVLNSSQSVRILQELNITRSGKRQNHKDEYFTIDNFYDIAGDDCENHAKGLVYLAYQIWERRTLRSDNITVVVAMLHDLLAHFQQPKTVYSPSKVHATRASTLLERDQSTEKIKNLNKNLVQIGSTRSFLESIRLNKEPQFILPDPQIYQDLWDRLENLLVFPPTIFEQDYALKEETKDLVWPKNYVRLSAATCRKITRRDSSDDSFIYIKKVSDDPADEQELPTRLSKNGKQVKDASSQATQCIHDFGQPWSQLIDAQKEEASKVESTKKALALLDLHKNISLLVEDDSVDFDLSRINSETAMELDNEGEDQDDNDDGDKDDVPDSDPEANNKFEVDLKRTERTIHKLRCLLNCTPAETPLRRSTRGSHQSLSENPKRKAQLSMSPSSVSKSKRRKSQPVRNIALT